MKTTTSENTGNLVAGRKIKLIKNEKLISMKVCAGLAHSNISGILECCSDSSGMAKRTATFM